MAASTDRTPQGSPFSPPRRGLRNWRGRGPFLVALGAAGWGAENLPRKRLDMLHLPAYPIVFIEHLFQVVFTLPWLLKNAWLIKRAPRRALLYVFLSGAVGSALGTVCYTAALDTVNTTVAGMLLNLQPVVSTIAGAMLFSERIFRSFFVYAGLAVLAGVAIAAPGFHDLTHLQFTIAPGLGLVFATVILWGFATAAGRGAMRDLPLGLATPLRLWSGLLTTGTVIVVRTLIGKGDFVLAPFLHWNVLGYFLLLTTLTGVIPLIVYFAGLATTPASIAGYCEMFYTLSATLIAWQFFGDKLLPHQAIAAFFLVAAILLLNRAAALRDPNSGVQSQAKKAA